VAALVYMARWPTSIQSALTHSLQGGKICSSYICCGLTFCIATAGRVPPFPLRHCPHKTASEAQGRFCLRRTATSGPHSSCCSSGNPIFTAHFVALIKPFFQLERAARYLYNPKRGLTKFSKDAWGAHAKAYWKSFQLNTELGNEGVKREQWDELEDLCSEKSKAELEEELDLEALDADLSILDDKRPLLFNFRSPSKLHR
jgi:hypothetical protein